MNCLRLLIEAGADVNISNDNWNTPLMLAAAKDNEQCLRMLLQAGANRDKTNAKGRTALMVAVKKDSESCVCELLKAGADVNKINEEAEFNWQGETALDMAVCENNINCVNMLIQAGANVNAQNRPPHVPEKPPIVLATEVGNIDVIRAGADVNATDERGQSALLKTIAQHDDNILNFLIHAGADVNVVDKLGNTPLIVAAFFGNVNCIILSLLGGTEINRVAMERNALAWHFTQCQFPDEAICKFLYSAGEDVDSALHSKLPKSLQFQTIKLQLKHICREVIRKHLLKLDPHQHLFSRIPKLGF